MVPAIESVRLRGYAVKQFGSAILGVCEPRRAATKRSDLRRCAGNPGNLRLLYGRRGAKLAGLDPVASLVNSLRPAAHRIVDGIGGRLLGRTLSIFGNAKVAKQRWDQQ